MLLRENLEGGEAPLMETHFVLQIPNIVIVPGIDELQLHFSKVITNLIGIHKSIVMWGQRYSAVPKRRNTLGIEIEDGELMPLGPRIFTISCSPFHHPFIIIVRIHKIAIEKLPFERSRSQGNNPRRDELARCDIHIER